MMCNMSSNSTQRASGDSLSNYTSYPTPLGPKMGHGGEAAGSGKGGGRPGGNGAGSRGFFTRLFKAELSFVG
jgi:hypothetical protein